MPKLPNSLNTWPSETFAQTLKSEIEELKPSTLPLAQGKYVDDDHLKVSVLTVTEGEQTIEANLGVFYHEIVAGCSCGDDPMTQDAYCEMQVSLNKATADAEFKVVSD